MNFKRNELQEFVEIEQGCYDINNWLSYKPSLLNWEINSSNIDAIRQCVKSDIDSYFLKALQSFTQALHEIKHEKYAWSITKLYYTIFYLLRCEILLSNHIMVRCGGLYYAKISNNEKLQIYRSAKLSGDHQLTIGLEKKLYDDMEITDPILGNQINGENPYFWLLKNRERVNYQMKNFTDPVCDPILMHIDTYFREHKLMDLFQFYNSNNDHSICFDTDHSIVAIPYKKMVSVYKRIKQTTILTDVSKRKFATSNSFLKDLGLSKKDIQSLINNA